MKRKWIISSGLLVFVLCQSANAQIENKPEVSFIGFTPQFLICIIAGVLLAMGFQVVLTVLSVAFGVSLVGNIENSKPKEIAQPDHKPKETTPMLVKISSGAGIWTIVTASLSLFFASMLAVKLSLISNNMLGLVLGLVIWAAFFMLLMYWEIKSVSSLIGGVFNAVLHGLRYSFAGLQKIFGTSTEARMAQIAQNTVTDLSKEFSEALGNSKLTKKMDKYIKELKPKELNFEKIREELYTLFSQLEIEEKIDRSAFGLDKNRLIKIIESNRHFNKKDVFKLVELLIEAWGIYQVARPASEIFFSAVKDFTSPDRGEEMMAKIENYLRQAESTTLQSEAVKAEVEKIIRDTRLSKNSLMEKLNELDRVALIKILTEKPGLEPRQINAIADLMLEALESIKQKITLDAGYQENQEAGFGEKIKQKIENSIRNYLASLERPGLDYDEIKTDLIAIFHHPKATFSALKNQLSRYDRETLIDMLRDQENISSEDAERLVSKIEEVRNYVAGKLQNIENEVRYKAEAAKQMALHEAEIVRKSAATAAWWLFATAIVSGLASAAGGILAIV